MNRTNNIFTSHTLRRVFRSLLINSLFVVAFSISAFAQEPLDSYPPPAKVMTVAERQKLEGETEVKKRTRLAIEFMDARLTKAELLYSQENWPEMFAVLGGFHALVDNTFAFLNGSDRNRDQVLNNFKRLEIGLRMFGPRVEVLRREIPLKYDFYLRSLALHLRRTRTKAIEPLFDDTVVPGDRPRSN
ncbi:MAG: hypothetical protein LC730_01765 [Acidobacteria bacterium]|nr:hypothetical protein [Acidobacteriota bacterium]MCA1608170.1 hypothetical protein [Acidobacteriota bacterium]